MAQSFNAKAAKVRPQRNLIAFDSNNASGATKIPSDNECNKKSYIGGHGELIWKTGIVLRRFALLRSQSITTNGHKKSARSARSARDKAA
jgi:hypothetical protein